MFNKQKSIIMKKIFLMAIMAVVAITANAQVYLGGSLGFASVSPEEGDTRTSFTIAPEAGYSLSDKVAIGMALGCDYVKDEYTQITVSPYVRYNAIQFDRVNIFLDGAVDFATYKPDGGDAQNAWGVGIKPGIEFKANDKISLVSHIGFIGYKDEHKITGNKTFGAVLTNAVTFGVYYNF